MDRRGRIPGRRRDRPRDRKLDSPSRHLGQTSPGLAQGYVRLVAIGAPRIAGTLSPLGESLVDVCISCTLPKLAPIGVHVDEFISGTNLELRPARTGDRFVGFDPTEDNPDPGEVIYVTSDSRVLTRRWV